MVLQCQVGPYQLQVGLMVITYDWLTTLATVLFSAIGGPMTPVISIGLGPIRSTKRTKHYLGGGFKDFGNFHPENWVKMIPIWRAYISKGLVKNHQAANIAQSVCSTIWQTSQHRPIACCSPTSYPMDKTPDGSQSIGVTRCPKGENGSVAGRSW